MKLRPAPASFLSRYVSSLAPMLVVGASMYASSALRYPVHVLVTGATLLLLVAGWVLRNHEASSSLGLFLMLILAVTAWHLHGVPLDIGAIPYIVDQLERINYDFPLLSMLSSLPVLLYTEAYRRSISYELSENSLRIEGGIIRRQVHDIPYDKIGRLVLEQGLLGRLLDYGTIIPVGVAAWGEEYYTRMVGAGAGKHGAGIAVGYARTLQEISRDPLKVLYGVPKPRQVYAELERRVTFTYEAEKEKINLLKSINEKLGKTNT